jgi:isoleucyl-tRNA synthetase
VELAPGDVIREFTAAQGYAGVADRGTQAAISTAITEELKLEGLARDIIRQVQNERKNAKLDLLDKIELHLSASAPELAKAIGTHRGAIATAVQATRWSDSPLTGQGVHSAAVKVDGQPLAVTLRKV